MKKKILWNELPHYGATLEWWPLAPHMLFFKNDAHSPSSSIAFQQRVQCHFRVVTTILKSRPNYTTKITNKHSFKTSQTTLPVLIDTNNTMQYCISPFHPQIFHYSCASTQVNLQCLDFQLPLSIPYNVLYCLVLQAQLNSLLLPFQYFSDLDRSILHVYGTKSVSCSNKGIPLLHCLTE